MDQMKRPKCGTEMVTQSFTAPGEGVSQTQGQCFKCGYSTEPKPTQPNGIPV